MIPTSGSSIEESNVLASLLCAHRSGGRIEFACDCLADMNNCQGRTTLPEAGMTPRTGGNRTQLWREPQRMALFDSAINAARIALASAVLGGCAVGLAARADADSGSDCNPLYLSMTPQPVLACSNPDAAPPADGSPAPGPVSAVAAPPPGAPPPAGQPPSTSP